MTAIDQPLTTEQAAKFIGVSVQTIYILVRNGRLPAFKPGTKEFRFEMKDLEAYKAARRVKA